MSPAARVPAGGGPLRLPMDGVSPAATCYPPPPPASNCATFASGGASPFVGASTAPAGALAQCGPVHPQKWTEDQVRMWWEKRTKRRKDIGLPSKGTDGRNIMRWSLQRFEQICNGNTGIAMALYQDLRNEIERYEAWRRATAAAGATPLGATPMGSPMMGEDSMNTVASFHMGGGTSAGAANPLAATTAPSQLGGGGAMSPRPMSRRARSGSSLTTSAATAPAPAPVPAPVPAAPMVMVATLEDVIDDRRGAPEVDAEVAAEADALGASCETEVPGGDCRRVSEGGYDESDGVAARLWRAAASSRQSALAAASAAVAAAAGALTGGGAGPDELGVLVRGSGGASTGIEAAPTPLVAPPEEFEDVEDVPLSPRPPAAAPEGQKVGMLEELLEDLGGGYSVEAPLSPDGLGGGSTADSPPQQLQQFDQRLAPAPVFQHRGGAGISPGRRGSGVIVTTCAEEDATPSLVDRRRRRASSGFSNGSAASGVGAATPPSCGSGASATAATTASARSAAQARAQQYKFTPGGRRPPQSGATPPQAGGPAAARSRIGSGSNDVGSRPGGAGAGGARPTGGVGGAAAVSRPGGIRDPPPLSAAAKCRTKSAPRPARRATEQTPPQMQQQASQKDGRRGDLRAATAARARGSTDAGATGPPTGPIPSRAPRGAGGAGGGRTSPQRTRPGEAPSAPAAKKPMGKAKVMEDLANETLAQISTPTRSRGSPPLFGGEAAAARRSLDDAWDVKRPAAARGGAGAAAPDAGDDEDGRKMFDKRELRKRHKGLFEQTLAQWRAQNLAKEPQQSSASASEASRVRVCVRKRPLFDYEKESDEFDIVSVRGGTEVVIHNCLTKADLRSLFVSHMGFQFAHVFGDRNSDDEVYAHCSAPAVEHVLNGGVSTLFMFGQTGSGKTHTMAGLIQRAARHLFRDSLRQHDDYLAEDEADRETLTLVAFEIAGKNMRDLLDTGNSGGGQKELKVMEDKEHRTHVLGAGSRSADSPEELLELIRCAQAHRATRATQVNDTSSRSHAVYRVYRGGASPGNPVLTLVDCAGSERREDSTHHDAQTRKDAAEINSTIFALKECFRVLRSSKGNPPYRDSLLTRVLSDSFSSDRAMIVAIGTVSPSATDTEHSVGTLRSLLQLQGTQQAFDHREEIAKPRAVELPHPRNWSEDEVRAWVESALGGAARAHAPGLTKGTDGKNITRWPVQRFVMLCGGDDDLGGRLYQDLRARQQGAGRGGGGAA